MNTISVGSAVGFLQSPYTLIAESTGASVVGAVVVAGAEDDTIAVDELSAAFGAALVGLDDFDELLQPTAPMTVATSTLLRARPTFTVSPASGLD